MPTDVLQTLTRAMFTSRLVCSCFKVNCLLALLANSLPLPLPLSRRMFTPRPTKRLALVRLQLPSGVPRPLSGPLLKLQLPQGRFPTGIVASTSFNLRAKPHHLTVLTSEMLGFPVLPPKARDRSQVACSQTLVALLDRLRWVIPTVTRRLTPYPSLEMFLVQAMNAPLAAAMPLARRVVLCRLDCLPAPLAPRVLLDLLDLMVVLLPLLLTRVVLSALLLRSALFAMSAPLRRGQATLFNSSTPVLPFPRKFRVVTPSHLVPRPLLPLLLLLRLPLAIAKTVLHLQ